MAQVRWRVRFEDRSRRSLDERTALRVPRVAQLIAALVLRLPPGSRLRKSLLSLSARRGFAAANRGDLEFLSSVLYAPDFELAFPAGSPPGFGSDIYRGADAFSAYGEWLEAWEDHRRAPCEIVDMGDRLVVLIEQRGRGSGSGVAVDQPIAYILTLAAGRVIRHEEFLNWTDALDAAGLRQNRQQPAE